MNQDLSFEEKIEKVRDILNKLGSPNLNLKDGISLYKEGFQELTEAQELLKNAKLEYEEIKLKDQK